MLRLDSVTVQLGPRLVLDRVSLAVNDRDRVALVGRNGAGKTTLLRVAAGALPADDGAVLLARGQDSAFLEQEQDPGKGTLWEQAMEALRPVLRLEERAQALMQEAAAMPAEDPRHGELLHDAETLHERFRHAGGYLVEATCGRVLAGLGFAETDWQRPAQEFSGGWLIRLGLARLLLQRPSFLLLDEPTNHLDIETRTWLLHELQAYPGGIVVVGHDRDFLDRLVSRTVEVAGGRLSEYSGGYTSYRAARELRQQQLVAEAASRAEERERIQSFVDRFRYKASKASQVQARIKVLEKLQPIEIPQEERRVRLQFPEAPPCGEPVLELRGARKSYGAAEVLRGADASLHRGERILLVGPNGAGKSTLLRLLAGREALDGGAVRAGPGVRVAWFAQDQARELPPEQTVLQAAAEADPLMDPRRLRALLGALLFSGESVEKRCGILSGGEKSRVALARILLQRANVLLLDEPTNHLDIETKETLADALGDWAGTLIFVSHDRAFADALATRVWQVGQGTVKPFSGGLEDFLWAQALELGVVRLRAPGERAPDAWLLGGLPDPTAQDGDGPRPSTEASGTGKGGIAPSAQALRDEGASAWKDRKKQQREQQRNERRFSELEEEIASREAALQRIDTELADPALAADWETLAAKLAEREALHAALASSLEEWERIGLLIEEGQVSEGPGLEG
jgi:ATP-binding cassette subfamily F protein 3